jgi:hypothetical protein
MKPGRFRVTLSVVATVLISLAIARLVEAVGKRELVRAADEVRTAHDSVRAEFEALQLAGRRLREDQEFLNFRLAAFSRREPYLILERARARLSLAVGDKTLLETRFRLRGPAHAQEELARLAGATLEVLATRPNTDWYRPDWLYRLEGVEPPPDSAARIVANAFGPGEVFLGGDIVIHGPASENVPPEAIDHSYIELDTGALKTVLDVVKPGTQVRIR